MAKPYIRNQAIALRETGYSYSHIAERLKVSKGTLSVWLYNIPYTPNAETIKWIGKARAASGLAKNRIRLQSIEAAKKQAKRDIGHITKRDLFMLGIGLYLGEGTKSQDGIRVINANPKIIRMAIKWFKESCGLSNSNFRIRIHLYPDNDIEEATKFWSKETGVPVHQFHKAQVDIRKNKKIFKRGKLPYGTAHLSIKSNGNMLDGIFLARKISAWIDEVAK